LSLDSTCLGEVNPFGGRGMQEDLEYLRGMAINSLTVGHYVRRFLEIYNQANRRVDNAVKKAYEKAGYAVEPYSRHLDSESNYQLPTLRLTKVDNGAESKRNEIVEGLEEKLYVVGKVKVEVRGKRAYLYVNEDSSLDSHKDRWQTYTFRLDDPYKEHIRHTIPIKTPFRTFYWLGKRVKHITKVSRAK